MFSHWILMCLAAVAIVQWSGTKVDAKEELDEVEKELVRALENTIKNQGKSNLNALSQRDEDEPCEEECGDIDEDSTIREVGECIECACGADPSLDFCDDDDDKRGQNNQPANLVRKVHLVKKGLLDLPRTIPTTYIPDIGIPRSPIPSFPPPRLLWNRK